MSLKIESNIPIPKPNTGRHAKYPFGEMKVGDSFLSVVDKGEKPLTVAGRVRGAAVGYSKIHKEIKFAVRILPEGVRCWRTA